MPELPARPSGEHLRKEAKLLARRDALKLAAAQRVVANGYGFRSWPMLMRHIESADLEPHAEPALYVAVRAGDMDAVGRLLAGGANPRLGNGRETTLHAAARRGPLALVQALLVAGALEWQTDAGGRTALDVARRGRPRDRAAILALLDRSAIADISFRAAIDAIHAGDVDELRRRLDAQPRLLRDRIMGPDAYRQAQRHDYFLDPKLFWFVANNPTLVERMPANITAVAQLMIERGIDQADLDYTLELTMSSKAAREQGHQTPLVAVLLAAGAAPTRNAIAVAAGYRELEVLRALLDAGEPMSAPIAAALGDDAALRDALPTASSIDVQCAFGLAVINAQVEAVRITLAAGADINAFLPVHAHSTALHQAAFDGHLALMRVLLARGARLDVRDTLWDGTPADWAEYGHQSAALELLERAPVRAGHTAANS